MVPESTNPFKGWAALMCPYYRHIPRILVKPVAFLIISFSIVWGSFSCKDSETNPSEKEIISFSIKNIPIEKVSIDQSKGIVEVMVPKGTILTDRLPAIELSSGATIVPSASVPQNFAQPVYYTVSGADGSKKVYKVTVVTAAEPIVSISNFSKDTLQAGDTLLVNGQNFGKSILMLGVYLKNTSGEETKINAQLLDSTRLRVVIPLETKPADYQIVLVKSAIKSISEKRVTVRIPSPVVTDLKNRNIRQGDTLTVAGNFIVPEQFNYRILLIGETSYQSVPFHTEAGKVSCLLPSTIPPGTYRIQLVNTTERTTSAPSAQQLTVYNRLLPFVKELVNRKSNYTSGETLVFRTINFQALPTRFYTVQLEKQGTQHNQNGIYSATDTTLSITVPSDIPNSTYAIRIIFLDSSGNELYELELDERVTIGN